MYSSLKVYKEELDGQVFLSSTSIVCLTGTEFKDDVSIPDSELMQCLQRQ